MTYAQTNRSPHGVTVLFSAFDAVLLVVAAYGLVLAARPVVARWPTSEWVRSVPGWAWWFPVAGLVLLFLGVLDAVTEGDDIAVFDGPGVAWAAARRVPLLDDAEIGATNLGGTIALIVGVGAVTALVCRRTRSWRPFWIALAGLGGVQVLVNGVKLIIVRPRPSIAEHLVTATGYSFPSGHSGSSIVGFGLIAWLLCMITANRTLRATAWTAAAIGALVVGLSRIYLGVHYPSDVLAGWLLGLAWLGAVAVAAKARPQKQPSPLDSGR